MEFINSYENCLNDLVFDDIFDHNNTVDCSLTTVDSIEADTLVTSIPGKP